MDDFHFQARRADQLGKGRDQGAIVLEYLHFGCVPIPSVLMPRSYTRLINHLVARFEHSPNDVQVTSSRQCRPHVERYVETTEFCQYVFADRHADAAAGTDGPCDQRARCTGRARTRARRQMNASGSAAESPVRFEHASTFMLQRQGIDLPHANRRLKGSRQIPVRWLRPNRCWQPHHRQ